MDGIQLRDEAVADRVRSAQEFLDPRIFPFYLCLPANYDLTNYSRWRSKKLSFRNPDHASKASAPSSRQY